MTSLFLKGLSHVVESNEPAPTIAGVCASAQHGIPKIVARHRTRSAIYAKVAGELATLLDMSEQEPPEWLPPAIRDVHGRYVAEMEHSTAEAERLLALQRTMSEPEHMLALLIANATPVEGALIREVAMRAGLMSRCECGVYNTAPSVRCIGCSRRV